MKNFDKYIKQDNLYKAIPEMETVDRLPPGVYSVHLQHQTQEIIFEQITTKHDALVDLPSPEYEHVISELEFFMEPGTKERFEKYGFLYKRSTLLYGKPGTGKTCMVNRIANKVVENGGVVLFNPEVSALGKAFKILEAMEPKTNVMVILEELDQILKYGEHELLNILDGEIQKNNVIYMATTNYIENIPARICRPGRFSSVVEVHFPSLEARKFYLKLKVPELPEELVELWAAVTEKFSIDDLKETVLAVMCLGQSLESVVNRVRKTKSIAFAKKFDSEEDMDFAEIAMTEEQLESLSNTTCDMTVPGKSDVSALASAMRSIREKY